MVNCNKQKLCVAQRDYYACHRSRNAGVPGVQTFPSLFGGVVTCLKMNADTQCGEEDIPSHSTGKHDLQDTLSRAGVHFRGQKLSTTGCDHVDPSGSVWV